MARVAAAQADTTTVLVEIQGLCRIMATEVLKKLDKKPWQLRYQPLYPNTHDDREPCPGQNLKALLAGMDEIAPDAFTAARAAYSERQGYDKAQQEFQLERMHRDAKLMETCVAMSTALWPDTDFLDALESWANMDDPDFDLNPYTLYDMHQKGLTPDIVTARAAPPPRDPGLYF